MKIRLAATRLGLRDSHTRIPFRYGSACMTQCPQAVLEATVVGQNGVWRGYSGDCLPPLWFDKSPDKSFEQQIEEMLGAIAMAERLFADVFRAPQDFFAGWLQAYGLAHDEGRSRGMTSLLISFAVSLLERALMDAMARGHHLSLFQAVHEDLYGIRAERIHPQLDGLLPRDWLPAAPRQRVFVRHTIGLGDPLTRADVRESDDPRDGFPYTLEEYLRGCGLRYFKIKVSNRLDQDMERLVACAALIERYAGRRYALTLDGNEQYGQAEQFDELVTAILAEPRLQTLWHNTLAIEQPLARGIALAAEHTAGIRRLAAHKPVIIDESDGELQSYPQAVALGYRGVSSKNCKGPLKSILNAGLTWRLNRQAEHTDTYLMTGEDLCTVGVIPTQSDLCLAALLGLEHVERNGYQYHPGLSYLPEDVQQQALALHGDFYCARNGRVIPCITDGQFDIASLQCPGFGFAVLPDLTRMKSAPTQ